MEGERDGGHKTRQVAGLYLGASTAERMKKLKKMNFDDKYWEDPSWPAGELKRRVTDYLHTVPPLGAVPLSILINSSAASVLGLALKTLTYLTGKSLLNFGSKRPSQGRGGHAPKLGRGSEGWRWRPIN